MYSFKVFLSFWLLHTYSNSEMAFDPKPIRVALWCSDDFFKTLTQINLAKLLANFTKLGSYGPMEEFVRDCHYLTGSNLNN